MERGTGLNDQDGKCWRECRVLRDEGGWERFECGWNEGRERFHR